MYIGEIVFAIIQKRCKNIIFYSLYVMFLNNKLKKNCRTRFSLVFSLLIQRSAQYFKLNGSR